MIQYFIISSLLYTKMYQLVNQPVFDLLLLLLALLVILNSQSRYTVTENKRLSYFILTDNTTPLTINTAIRAKSTLYTVKLDIGLQTTQKIKGTEKYINISLIFFICILSITITALKIRDILMYFLVPFILYIIYRLISSFTVYKVLFALIAVLTVKGVVLTVNRVVLLVSIK